jgi:DNA-binding response OmpR family regulator
VDPHTHTAHAQNVAPASASAPVVAVRIPTEAPAQGPGDTTVLVVDDDRKTTDLVRLYLEKSGYRVVLAVDGEEALRRVEEHAPDLMVLDLMLPKLDGLDVCHEVRKQVDLPVIMLTARTTEEDRLAGLETGADDYVTKPFSPRELVARVRAVLRRTQDAAEGTRGAELRLGDLVLDFRRREVRRRGIPVQLTPREFSIMAALAREPGRVFSRAELLERAFGFDYEGLERTVDVHLKNLRRKIEDDPRQPALILTVPGFGYKLAEPQ